MTDDEIDKLSIAEVRAIVTRAGDALKALAELGIAPRFGRGPVAAILPAQMAMRVPGEQASQLQPYPCAMCGRAAPVTPQEQASLGEGAPECGACGNPMAPVGAKLTNKGHPVISPAQRAAMLSQPAFDPKTGEPNGTG